MSQRLVILSDMWGVKKGTWITSYLGYLQHYFDIIFYDCQQLANVEISVNSEENLHKEFVEGGIDTAVAHLLSKETEKSHYLAFSVGGTIAWKAALKGLPVKSLYLVSATRVREEEEKPKVATTLLFGDKDLYKPSEQWSKDLAIALQTETGFGHELYSDEKIIKKVCKALLDKVTYKQQSLN